MEKFTLFDFLSFLLPAILFLYPVAEIYDIHFLNNIIMVKDNVITIMVFLCFAYFVGHALSLLGRVLLKFIYKKDFHTLILSRDKNLSELFNQCFTQVFDIKDLKRNNLEQDLMTSTLENYAKDKIGHILLGQKSFFRNLGTSFFIWLIIQLICVWGNKLDLSHPFSILAITLMSFISCILLYIDRDKKEALSNINNFISFV